jgi:hypothetical protein
MRREEYVVERTFRLETIQCFRSVEWAPFPDLQKAAIGPCKTGLSGGLIAPRTGLGEGFIWLRVLRGRGICACLL